MDDAGRPVPGATVQVFAPVVLQARASRTPLVATVSDKDGRYAVDVDRDVVDLRFVREGFADVELRVAAEEVPPVILRAEAAASAIQSGGSAAALQTGRIFAGRKPLPGVEIIGEKTSVFTDAEGAYRLEEMPIRAVHPDYFIRDFREAIPIARIGGHVRDDDGKPVVLATVVALAANDEILGAGVTAPDGRFVLDDILPNAAVRLRVSKKGFERLTTDAAPVLVGERRMKTDLVVRRAALLEGRVTDDAGRPLRASIAMRNADHPEDNQVVETRGEYSVAIPRGRYDIRVTARGYATKQLDTNVTASTKLDFILDAAAELTGVVMREGSGVAGITVKAGDASTVTDAQGRFTLSDVPAGEVRVTAESVTKLAHAPGDVVIELPAKRELRGRVVDASTNQPIPAFTIAMEAAGRAASQPFTDGTFVLDAPSGLFILVATADQYMAARTLVTPGQQEVELRLTRGSTLHGTIRSAEGDAIAGAHIEVIATSSSTTTSDARGNYSMSDLPRETVVVTVTAKDFQRAEATVQLNAGATRHDVVLRRGAELQGRVLSAEGPVADAEITAASESGTDARASTNANGEFVIRGLVAGRYNVIAMKRGYARSAPVEVTVPPAPITISMSRGGVIVGRVNGGSATVVASGRFGIASAQTDAAGNFRIDDAPLGIVEVIAHAGERRSEKVTIDVIAGSEVTVQLTIAP